ncbi:MAG: hypothetical protein HZB14_04870 [Actinobacteria bacterium]|nr:hypothetical protein [Actinomycetota bacterium]
MSGQVHGGPVEFCGIELAHPIVNGSGTYDALAARRVFGAAFESEFPFAAYVSKTITLAQRAGNPPPRLWELGQGMINSIGLPNKGLERFVSEDLPAYATLPAPLFVSVMGFSPEELEAILDTLADRDEIAAFELNFSCPNVKTGNIVGSVPAEGSGGISGPAIRPVALAHVARSAERVDIPLIGMGGVECGRHAADLLAVGAALVAVGTENFRDPAAGNRIVGELRALGDQAKAPQAV